MLIEKSFIRIHKASYAIVLFLFLFFTIHMIKPGFAYGPDGEFRPFGLGYRNKTVLPVWTLAIALAIFSYLAVLWYLAYT
jgi:hypothetical protein